MTAVLSTAKGEKKRGAPELDAAVCAGRPSGHVLGGINPWWTPTHDAYTNAKIRRGERPRRNAEAAESFLDWIRDNLAALEQRNNYGSAENRTEVRETLQRALEVFEQRRAEAE